MTGYIYTQLIREVHSKHVVYAWSVDFLNSLRRAAQSDPAIVVERFPSPRAVEGLAEPPIGVARLTAEAMP